MLKQTVLSLKYLDILTMFNLKFLVANQDKNFKNLNWFTNTHKWLKIVIWSKYQTYNDVCRDPTYGI